MTAVLVINPFETAVEWQSETFVYNGKDQSASVSAKFKNVDKTYESMTVSYLGQDGKAKDQTIFKDAGNYTVVATYNHTYSNNYNIANSEITLNIAQYNLDN